MYLFKFFKLNFNLNDEVLILGRNFKDKRIKQIIYFEIVRKNQ